MPNSPYSAKIALLRQPRRTSNKKPMSARQMVIHTVSASCIPHQMVVGWSKDMSVYEFSSRLIFHRPTSPVHCRRQCPGATFAQKLETARMNRVGAQTKCCHESRCVAEIGRQYAHETLVHSARPVAVGRSNEPAIKKTLC
jgi:hypothetical protein